MKKVLFVVDERRMGGVSIVLEDYLNNLNLSNYKVDLLVLHNVGDRLEKIPNNINVIYIDSYFDIIDESIKKLINSRQIFKIIKKVYFSFLMKTGLISSYIKTVRKKEKITGYDVEISFKAGFCTLFTGHGDSKKKIDWVHSDYSTADNTARYRKTFNKCIKKFTNIVTISEDIKKAFNEAYNGYEDKIIVIKNYLNDDRIISMSKEKNDNKLNKKKINIVSVGRLSEEKSYNRLIEACVMLKNYDKSMLDKIQIDIIGDGEEKEKLETMLHENGLNKTIHLLGRKNNPYTYMKDYDLFILASKTEAYSLVMVESLILKVPVLTTKVASVSYILENEKYGKVVDNNVNGIYNGLKSIIEDTKQLNTLKKNLFNYSYKSQNKTILKQIQKLLEE